MPPKWKVFVVPHTHWDRAWYLGFEEFRMRLVRLVNRACDTLEKDPAFTNFCLDGQTVVIEDYLAVRPKQAERLKKLVQKGRLWIGPWYVLPDEFLVSAESMVRNLILGHRISAEFGHTMAVGYVPDPFGHIAQLPQILRGFGLDSFLFSRGLDMSNSKLRPEFQWRAPDGSAVLAIHQRFFYNNAAFLGYRIGWGDAEMMALDKGLAMEQIEKACKGLETITGTRSLLLNNGVDHSEHQPELPGLLRMAAQKFPQYNFRIASFEHYVNSVKRDLAGKRLQRKEGELYYDFGDMLHGVYSSRMYLKMANQHCQDLLEKSAEPLAAMAWLAADVPYPQDQLWYAWRELLKSHPHDDICGCSVDQVHRDMEHRFGVVDQVARPIARDSLRAIARRLDNSRQPGVPIVVFNPLGTRRRGVTTIPIDLYHHSESWKRLILRDERGQKIPYDLLKSEDQFWMETLKGFEVRRHLVQLELDVPPFGYRTLYAQEGKPSQATPRIKAGARTFENEFYRLAIVDNGTLRLFDKSTKTPYRDLLLFEDTEDFGDEYNWSPLRKNSRPLTTVKSRPQIRRVHVGPFGAAWRVTHRLRIPEGLTPDRAARSNRTVTIEIVSEVRCHAGSPRADVITRVHNNAKDHRLRVLFPTNIATDTVHVDGHYGVIERTTIVPPPKGKVPPYTTQHQGRFADLGDGKRGLAIINFGLPEFEVVRKGARRILAQTLFRCTDMISREDLVTRPGHTGPPSPAPDAQCLRPMEFRYAFMAHRGDWQPVLRAALEHNVPPCVSRCDIHGGTDPKQIAFYKHDAFLCAQPMREVSREGTLPDHGSLLDLGSDRLVLSAVKKCETRNSLIVRLYNPGAETIKATLKAFRPIKRAYLTNLNEQRRKTLVLHDGCLHYTCPGYKVLTFELVL
ncbi:MAG: hypothetical protein HY706_08830 [Candidatus Hydrogenedentes bacterium]|nr:hypothetical protein [Candidatus Hydrogenedentota bacterium]